MLLSRSFSHSFLKVDSQIAYAEINKIPYIAFYPLLGSFFADIHPEKLVIEVVMSDYLRCFYTIGAGYYCIGEKAARVIHMGL